MISSPHYTLSFPSLCLSFSFFPFCHCPFALKLLYDPVAASMGYVHTPTGVRFFSNKNWPRLFMSHEEMEHIFRQHRFLPHLLWRQIVDSSMESEMPEFWARFIAYCASEPSPDKECSSICRCVDKHGRKFVALVRGRIFNAEDATWSGVFLWVLPLPNSRHSKKARILQATTTTPPGTTFSTPSGTRSSSPSSSQPSSPMYDPLMDEALDILACDSPQSRHLSGDTTRLPPPSPPSFHLDDEDEHHRFQPLFPPSPPSSATSISSGFGGGENDGHPLSTDARSSVMMHHHHHYHHHPEDHHHQQEKGL